MHTPQDHIADAGRALTRGRRVILFVGAAAFLTVAGTASAATATPPGEHNARVAEHLLQQRTATSEHNARVAEYLLLRRGS